MIVCYLGVRHLVTIKHSKTDLWPNRSFVEHVFPSIELVRVLRLIPWASIGQNRRLPISTGVHTHTKLVCRGMSDPNCVVPTKVETAPCGKPSASEESPIMPSQEIA